IAGDEAAGDVNAGADVAELERPARIGADEVALDDVTAAAQRKAADEDALRPIAGDEVGGEGVTRRVEQVHAVERVCQGAAASQVDADAVALQDVGCRRA